MCFKNIICSFLLVSVAQCNAIAQAIDTVSVLKEMSTAIKSLKEISYSYTEKMEFPNGEKDSAGGKIIMDMNQKMYFNDCDAFTMLCTKQWYYRADHRSKTITIIDLRLKANRKYKTETENNIFSNEALNTFFDSVILSRSVVKSITKDESGFLKIVLNFLKGSPIQSLDITYNERSRLPVSYNILVFRPATPALNEKKGVKAILTASDFKVGDEKAIADEHNYFSYEHGKPELKKYTKYKLVSKT